MEQRQAAANKTRARILRAARQLLLAKDFSAFTMEAVADRADVSRLTVYYQFGSKSGLLEALYDHLARRGNMERLAQVFGRGRDPLETLRGFIRVFAEFWASNRDVIRRLHALAAIDSEIGKGLRARNERRRKGASVVVDRLRRTHSTPGSADWTMAIDAVHMLTSFETFDDLQREGRSLEDLTEIIEKLAWTVLGIVTHP